jgi:predicted Zn-dependent protease
MAKKKKKPQGGRPAKGRSRGPGAALDEVVGLMRRGQLARAAAQLEELDRRHPNDRDITTLLAEVYFDLNDANRHLAASQRLANLAPDWSGGTRSVGTSPAAWPWRRGRRS